ncbi:hypothetical protein [Tenacibaculum maritimum]|uniref:hypothetical protein n=1 Tax=Tenacibaculum maritimum TaxID=107401 RepID=UPI0012E490A1|nr:hypothetical protein [Tenacibaculum maritimum]CAA0157654.1 conserved hypothetical protein [Tenacibaculum maritimum]
MIRANLKFNYYFPFYTIKSFGKKRYSHTETVCIHLSDKRRFLFKLSYKKGKLKEIKLEHILGDYFDFNDKKVKQISYIDFATKMRSFENFLERGLILLKSEQAYYKTMVLSEVYKFNINLELTFTYGELHLKTGNFPFRIENGKLNRLKKNYGDSSFSKVEKYLDAWDSNYEYRQIDESKFTEELNYVMSRYVPFLSAPTLLRKKGYSEKNIK